MDFATGLRNLQDGRAIKRPSWKGYVERQMITAGEATPAYWDSTKSDYTVGTKVTYNNNYYICILANPDAGSFPSTDTTHWSPYTLLGEEYQIIFHNRAGTTYAFKYTPNAPEYSGTATYAKDALVTYQGHYYKCKANGTTGILPTVTASWDSYLPSSESLILDKELLGHISASDWIEGSAADFAEAASAASSQEW